MNKQTNIIYPTNFIVWDLETSGLDPKKDKILEIGAMKVSGDKILEEKSWLLNHQMEISDFTTNLTGINKKMIDENGVDPAVAMNEFLNMFNDSFHAHITHNGFRFDIPFLIGAMNDTEKELYKVKIWKGCFDTAVLVKANKLELDRMWNESFLSYAQRIMEIRAFGVKYNIPLCCDEMEIDTSDAQFHRALGDVKLTYEIYKKLI